MASLNYRNHARAKPLEALLFRAASRYEPALEGLTRGHISMHMLDERERCKEGGVRALVKAAVARLTFPSGGKAKWRYTKRHSIETGFFVYVMARETQEQGRPESRGLDPSLVFAGGLIHDVGKTFLPLAIVVKELGVDMFFFSLFEGARLTDAERRVLRYEHITTGTTFVRLFGGGDHIRTVLDMVGLHHVTYNGVDTGVPSYPSLLKGKDLPFHSRIAKTADFVSAVLPRHYRQDARINSLDDAVAYAISVAGMELDPLTVRNLMTGFYKIDPSAAQDMIERLVNPGGQEGISNLRSARQYARDFVAADPTFKKMVGGRATAKILHYEAEAMRCAKAYGVGELIEIPTNI